MRTLSVTAPSSSVHAVPGLVRGDGWLDVAENSFRLLCVGPAPLSVHGRRIGLGLPARRIVLTELASILMHPSTSYEARDAVWRLLVARARSAGPSWVIGAVGVALPGLRHGAARLGRLYVGDAEAEMLAGFLATLSTLDLDGPRVFPRLCNAAHSAARATLRRTEPTRRDEITVPPTSTVVGHGCGHPDFVLARAVTAGILSADEAEVIGATYLEGVPLADYADRIGVTRWSLYKTRARAVQRLSAAIRAGAVSDHDAEVIAEATSMVVPDPQYRI